MPPHRVLPSLATVAVLAGACAGGSRLDPPVAEDLAARADALAVALEAGDACAALDAGGALVHTASAERDRGTVPTEVAAEVIGTTRAVVAGLTCDPAPAEEAPSPSPAPAEPPAPAADGDEDDDDSDDEPPGRGAGKARGQERGKGPRGD